MFRIVTPALLVALLTGACTQPDQSTAKSPNLKAISDGRSDGGATNAEADAADSAGSSAGFDAGLVSDAASSGMDAAASGGGSEKAVSDSVSGGTGAAAGEPAPSNEAHAGTGGLGAAGAVAGDGVAGDGVAGEGAGGRGATGGASGMAGDLAPEASAELFDQERVPRFDITLSAAAIAALGSAPSSYVRGDVQYGAITLHDVGVRIKGEASLRTLAQKAALKLKLDEFVSGQNLLGLKRITLNNMVSDPSFIAERLAYHMYRAAKLPAPRCNSALVYVNGEFYGVYANVESEDKVFLRRWFASDDGNLYEDAQVDLQPGNDPFFNLETNEALNDRSDLRGLISALNSAGTDSFLADLDATLDTEHFLRFTALEAAVDQWDMYGHTFFDPNNFRLYHDPTTNKFTFLPWGMDMALKPLSFTQRAHIPVLVVPRYEDQPGARAAGGLIFVRCLASTSCKARYAQLMREVVVLWDAEKLELLAAHHYAQIKDYVYQDTRKELSNQAFEAGYQSLLTTIQTRSAAILSELEQAGL